MNIFINYICAYGLWGVLFGGFVFVNKNKSFNCVKIYLNKYLQFQNYLFIFAESLAKQYLLIISI